MTCAGAVHLPPPLGWIFSPATGCAPTHGDPCVALARAMAVAISPDAAGIAVGTTAAVLLTAVAPGVLAVAPPPQAARIVARKIKLSTSTRFKRFMSSLSLSQLSQLDRRSALRRNSIRLAPICGEPDLAKDQAQPYPVTCVIFNK